MDRNDIMKKLKSDYGYNFGDDTAQYNWLADFANDVQKVVKENCNLQNVSQPCLKHKIIFKDFKEFKQFMIFCHTHYELNDVWHFENGNKGILFEGAWNNSGGNQKYSPLNLPEDQQPQYSKRNSLEEVYDVWQKVRANLVKFK